VSKKLLKAAAIINLLEIAAVLFGAMNLGIIGIIILILFAIPGIALGVSSIIFFNYSSQKAIELVKHKTAILIWGIALLFICLPSGILTLIALGELDVNEDDEKATNEEPIDKETKRLDTILKLGVGLVALSGVMFATSSWDMLSGWVKTIGLLLFSILFFVLSKFVGTKLKIRRSEITYYILGNLFFVFTLIAIGYFNLFGNWFSLIGDGSNLFMAMIFAILTLMFIISLKKYNQLRLLHLIYASALIALTYVGLQIGSTLKVMLLLWSILALALSINKNELNIYTKILNDFGRALIAILLFGLVFEMGNKESIWVSILAGIILISASYIQALWKSNYIYKIMVPFFTVLYSFCISVTLRAGTEISLIVLTLVTTAVYTIAYIKRNEKELYISTFSVTSLAFLYYYIVSINESQLIIALIITLILVLLNMINLIGNPPKHTVCEEYSQPIKLLMLINAISLLISSHVDNLGGNTLLLSIGVVFVLGYFIQKNNVIKNIYFWGSVAANVLYYLDIFFMSYLPQSFVLGAINIISLIVLTIVTFKSTDYKEKIKELAFFGTSLVTFYNVISITANYDILLLGVLILTILFMMLAITFVNNRYVFGISTIMLCYTGILLINDVLSLSWELDTILISLMLFIIVFVFIHAILGNAHPKVKNVLETIALSLLFLLVIFEDSWLIGLYITALCVLFIIKGFNSKFLAYFYTGIVFLLLNVIVQLKSYWESIPAWAYILVGGLVLIGAVTYKEYKRTNPKVEEVKEEQKEDLIEEKNNENKSVKYVKDEIIVIAILMLFISYINFSALTTKIIRTNIIENGYPRAVEKI